MNIIRLIAAAAIAAGVGISTLTSGGGLVTGAPLGPPSPAPAFQPDPGGPEEPGIPAEKCWRYGRSGGGNPPRRRRDAGIPAAVPLCHTSRTAALTGRSFLSPRDLATTRPHLTARSCDDGAALRG